MNRLSSICPYFAMFPDEFARRQIEEYSKPGDWVYDCFSGRGTTTLQALLLQRRALSNDINPVAYCISAAKSKVPSLSAVRREVTLLEERFFRAEKRALERERSQLPRFFRRAFYHSTLRQLLFLRSALQWRRSFVHRFIAALVLGSLHGEMDKSSSYFSNQMPRTISTKPDYSVGYWDALGLWPKKKNVFELLRQRAEFRLGNGDVPTSTGHVAMGDSREAVKLFPAFRNKIKLILTSPPYFNVTNYEEDQWLRLWFLGGEARPTYGRLSKDDRHSDKARYWKFLAEVWEGIEPLVNDNCTLVCRIGAKGLTQEEIVQGLTKSLKGVFDSVRTRRPPVVSRIRNRQTDTFLPGTKGCVYEMDVAFALK